jgi:hypothetical protein
LDAPGGEDFEMGEMRKFLTCVAFVAATGVAGCGYTPEQRATSGGLIGAGTGAAIASAAGGGPGAVIAGALLGGGTGALIGANTRPAPPPPPPVYVAGPPPRCAEIAEDMYGRRYCRAYYGY